ncbi:MAG: LacI family transcriptional regulator [Lentisphaerae bacterium]|nr:LacI family transcriptional regulator [Lentisphaerota bacterium]
MVTQKEIAREVGVSVSLVSHVLGGRGRKLGVAAGTMARIQEAAQRRGYQPSTAALVLRGQSARTIGVVVKDFDDPYLGHLVGGLHRLARDAGYALLLTGCDATSGRVVPVLGPLTRYPLDGILLVGSDVDGGWFAPFARQGLRGVQIGTGCAIPGMHRVGVDEAAGMALVTAHLVQRGHRRIAFAGFGAGVQERRGRAFDACLRRAGVRPVRVAGWRAADKRGLEGALRDRGQVLGAQVTAVVAADDEAAQLVIHAAHVQGLQVPRDVAVTGMDDIPLARLMTPALTTVRAPLAAMTRAAFEWLVASPVRAPGAAVFQPELIVRESSANWPSVPGVEVQARGCERRRV